MAKTSILVPDGESTITKFVVHCLSLDKDVDIHILSKKPHASIKHSKFIKSFHTYNNALLTGGHAPEKTGNATLDELIEYHHYDPARSEALIAEILRVAKETKAEIIFPIDEHIVKVLAAHQDKFHAANIRTIMPEHAMFSTAIDKSLLAEFLKAHNIPHPVTLKYSSGVADETVRALSFPVLIKPINLGNAMGIQSFGNADDLLAFLKGQDLKHEYIIQPFINGYDIDCSVLCDKGKVLSYTIQKGILSPKAKYRAAVGIEFLYEKAVIDVVEKMMGLLNWSGVAHIDLRYDQDKKEVKIIEINGRYWGSLLGSLNAGINFPQQAYKTALGKPFETKTYKFNRYFMGKAPIPKLLGSLFSSSKDKIRFRDTSLYFSAKDPGPVFYEIVDKLKRKF